MQITATEVEDKSMYARSSEAIGLYKKSPSLIAPGFLGISTDAFFAGQAGRQADR